MTSKQQFTGQRPTPVMPSLGQRDGESQDLSRRVGQFSNKDLAALLLIRHFENKLLELFSAGHIAGTTHTCLGQEYVPVALHPLLGPSFVFSNHRGHGHYLAQFGDIDGLLAEITGRQGAVCQGYGGSQHLYNDGFCATGVQGENVPVALGAALHFKTSGKPHLAVAYIGDGTWGEGVVYETLNMAQLWRAPLVVVVENNGIAQTTRTADAMAGSVADRAAAFGVRYQQIEGWNVPAIRQAVSEPIQLSRVGGGPLVLEFRTDRLGPHSKGDDTRTPAEIKRAESADWATWYARQYSEQFVIIDQQQRRLVDSVTADVLARPFIDGRPR